jgi:hypothetical protein
VSVIERTSGVSRHLIVFTIRLAEPAPSTVIITAQLDYQMTAQGDFEGGAIVPQTIAIGPGQSSAEVIYKIAQDTALEGNETFRVLSRDALDPSGISFSKSIGIGTIVDDDPGPTADIAAGAVQEGDSGARAGSNHPRLSAPWGAPDVHVVPVAPSERFCDTSNVGLRPHRRWLPRRDRLPGWHGVPSDHHPVQSRPRIGDAGDRSRETCRPATSCNDTNRLSHRSGWRLSPLAPSLDNSVHFER